MKCLICNKDFIRVCRHAQQKHGVMAREYKEMFGLDVKKGILDDESREVLRKYAKEYQAHKNFVGKGEKFWFKKGESNNYKRSEQTIKRLKKQLIGVGGHPPTVDKIEIQCALCGAQKMIFPRYLIKGRNFCGVVCRNRFFNKFRKKINL